MMKARVERSRLSKGGPNKLFFAAVNLGNVRAVRKFIENGADVNQRTSITRTVYGEKSETAHGYTALHIAVSQLDCDMVKLLLDSGAQMCCRSSDDIAPLEMLPLTSQSWKFMIAEHRKQIEEDHKKRETIKSYFGERSRYKIEGGFFRSGWSPDIHNDMHHNAKSFVLYSIIGWELCTENQTRTLDLITFEDFFEFFLGTVISHNFGRTSFLFNT